MHSHAHPLDEVLERRRPGLSYLGPRPLLENYPVELGRALDLREGFRETAYLPKKDSEGVNIARETVAEPKPDLWGHVPVCACFGRHGQVKLSQSRVQCHLAQLQLLTYASE